MKKFAIVILAILMSGCSTRFVYNNADWLVHWYLDDYVNLTKEQEQRFDDMFSSWLVWHRQNELPQYHAQLDDIIDEIITGNITAESIAQHRERLREHWVRARTYVAEDIVELAVDMSDEQMAYFFDQLEEKNLEDEEELQERLEMDTEKQTKDWVKRNQKNSRRWFGRLSDEQKDFITRFSDRFNSTRGHWIEYRREYQQQLKATFEMEDRGEVFKTQLHDLIVDPERFRSETFQQAMKQNEMASTEYILGLQSLMTDKQIERLVDEINELRDDLMSLQN